MTKSRFFRWGTGLFLLGLLLLVLVPPWRHAVIGSVAELSSPDSPAGYATGIGNPVWSADRGKETIAGIDHASITCGLWSDGRMAVVVWTDVSSGSSRFLPPITTKAEGFVFEGHHRATDGRHIDCRCATKDGRTGGVTINGKTFGLDQGALFLVSTISGQTQVRQLKREVLQSGGGDLRDLAKNDQEIRDFFASFAKAK
jgi:hypothetical protein